MKLLSRRSGFSLVELLTVIAIIAILAAIIFPVMARVKQNANETNCATNLHQIAIGVQMFKQDNRRYPNLLSVEAIPGQRLEDCKGQDGVLFAEYVKSEQIFHCPSSKVTNSSDIISYETVPGDPNSVKNVYAYDSYSCHLTGIALTSPVEPHYRLSWVPPMSPDQAVGWIASSGLKPYPLGTDDNNAIRQQDYERQLRFRNPPDSTLIAWCANHETREGADPAGWRGNALAVFLDGSVDKFPANEMEQCMWRIRPKKS